MTIRRGMTMTIPQRYDFKPGWKYKPNDVRIASREILEVGVLFVKYRTFNDGRLLPLVRNVTIYTMANWIEKRVAVRVK